MQWLNYGARFYDAAVGRFWTRDRYSEKYSWMSPYQYAGNSPVMNIDVNGDSLTDRAEQWAAKLENYANKQIDKLQNRIDKRLQKHKKVERLEEKLAEYRQVIYELNVLRSSSQWYDVKEVTDIETPNGIVPAGKTFYDLKTKMVVMLVNTRDYDLGIVAHEFKHAYQFEIGEIAFDPSGERPVSALWDIYDEREANFRASLFGSQTHTPETGYSRRTNVYNIKMQLLYKLINQRVILRFYGKTYNGN